jgi:hypothetical protein
MDSSFNSDRPDDDLSTAFGTETLAERDMVPEGFANTPTSRTDIPVEVIGGGRYLRVKYVPMERWQKTASLGAGRGEGREAQRRRLEDSDTFIRDSAFP